MSNCQIEDVSFSDYSDIGITDSEGENDNSNHDKNNDPSCIMMRKQCTSEEDVLACHESKIPKAIIMERKQCKKATSLVKNV